MEKKSKTDERSRSAAAREMKRDMAGYVLLLIIAIAAIAISATLAYYLLGNHSTPFSTFMSNFNKAGRVALYTTAYNGSQLSSALGCSTAIIEVLTGNPYIHRNSSTIDFFVMNQTSCVFEHGVGGVVTNYTYNTTANCINTSKTEPSIFINYSDTNSTRITPQALYVAGDSQFLAICGIASELS